MGQVVLSLAVFISTVLLVVGLAAALVDIEYYGWGLYLILVAVVGFIIVAAFCLVGTEQQTQPTIAKQVWSTTRQTIRRYTPMLPRSPLGATDRDPAVEMALEQQSSQSHVSSTSLSGGTIKGPTRPPDHPDCHLRVEFDDGVRDGKGAGVHYV